MITSADDPNKKELLKITMSLREANKISQSLSKHIVSNNETKILKKRKKSVHWLKLYTALDVSDTTVVFFSKDKKCKCLTASCLVYVYNV